MKDIFNYKLVGIYWNIINKELP